MYRELLTADCCGTREKYCFAFATLLFQYIIYSLIIQVSVVIVHLFCIGMVKIFDSVHRNSFTEVRFEAVHTHIQKSG